MMMPIEKKVNKLFSLLAFVFVSMMLVNAAMQCNLMNIEECGHKTNKTHENIYSIKRGFHAHMSPRNPS